VANERKVCPQCGMKSDDLFVPIVLAEPCCDPWHDDAWLHEPEPPASCPNCGLRHDSEGYGCVDA
jgi:hypothetical protein